MNAHSPVLMDFGPVSVVAPNGWPRLTGRQWADIEAAMIMASNGQSDAAAAIVVDFEERLGTRPAHRFALSNSAEALNSEIGRANRRRQRDERERVRQLQAPWKPPGPDLKLVAKAQRKVNSGDPKQVKEGVAELVTLEEARQARADSMRISAEQAEIKELAVGRGEEIAVETKRKEHVGRIRIVSRDGLERLFFQGTITPIQYAAGMRYRDAYEKVDPEKALQPLDYGGVHSASHGGEGFAAKRLAWVNDLHNVERQVIERGQHRYALTTLQQVAGNRRSIRSMAGSGGLRAQQIVGLKLALDICAEHFGVK